MNESNDEEFMKKGDENEIDLDGLIDSSCLL